MSTVSRSLKVSADAQKYLDLTDNSEHNEILCGWFNEVKLEVHDSVTHLPNTFAHFYTSQPLGDVRTETPSVDDCIWLNDSSIDASSIIAVHNHPNFRTVEQEDAGPVVLTVNQISNLFNGTVSRKRIESAITHYSSIFTRSNDSPESGRSRMQSTVDEEAVKEFCSGLKRPEDVLRLPLPPDPRSHESTIADDLEAQVKYDQYYSRGLRRFVLNPDGSIADCIRVSVSCGLNRPIYGPEEFQSVRQTRGQKKRHLIHSIREVDQHWITEFNNRLSELPLNCVFLGPHSTGKTTTVQILESLGVNAFESSMPFNFSRLWLHDAIVYTTNINLSYHAKQCIVLVPTFEQYVKSFLRRGRRYFNGDYARFMNYVFTVIPAPYLIFGVRYATDLYYTVDSNKLLICTNRVGRGAELCF